MEKISNLRAFKRNARPILAGLAVGLCFIWAQNALAASPQHIDKEAKTCERAIQHQERRTNIPKGLLNAISFAESGRWNASGQATIAWPWTVTTGGKGHFLPNRADAVAFVKSLRADGVENIDVGCLQINLKYHPDAFVSIEHAFDPNANAAYAADFLSQRFALSKSWIKAAGDYHSTTPALNKAYRTKVAKIWNKVQKRIPSIVTQAKASVAPINSSMTNRFNDAFRARTASNAAARPGLAIANRVNALKPGAFLDRPKGQALVSAFAQKRQSQLMTWRLSNGTHPGLMPTIPSSISVQ